MKRNTIVLLLVLVLFGSTAISLYVLYVYRPRTNHNIAGNPMNRVISPTPTPTPFVLPARKILTNNYHIYQSFNNCGPAALSMALSYYGINVSQSTLGQQLRPYQNSAGDNDDKSVTLEELAKKAEEYGLMTFHRPNGSIEMMKKFIAYDIPVLTRTWTKVDEDIGHYRVVKGYDDETQELTQDDSLQGKNLNFSYQDFLSMWEKFNFEYVVLIPQDKKTLAEEILREDVDLQTAWRKAADNAKRLLAAHPQDMYARFNLSVALYNIGDYQGSIDEFEQVEAALPLRTLWYQIEPIEAYYEVANYDRVFAVTSRILNNQNRAFSELYLIRGRIYQKQDKTDLARSEFEKAVLYNSQMDEAQEALQSLQ